MKKGVFLFLDFEENAYWVIVGRISFYVISTLK
jgi:hypothetical protein